MNAKAVATLLLTMLAVTPVLAQNVQVSLNNSRPTGKGPAEYFTGDVMVTPMLPSSGPHDLSAGHVTFTPGARSNWHSHPAGQALVVTSGTGWVQEWGGEKREIKPGDVIWTPPDVKHWHGATDVNTMSHIAIQEAISGKAVEWLERVTDDQFKK